MRKILLLASIAALLGACQQKGEQFTIQGQVSGAEGKTIIFENAGINGTVVLDSLRLKQSGEFTFKGQRPSAPEFYRLRLDGKIINLAVDSTETINVSTSFENYETDYQVEGSANNEKIKEIALLRTALVRQLSDMVSQYRSGKLMSSVYQMRADQAVDKFKEQIRNKYILSAPNTSYAYFALFQKVDNYLMFDPLNDREDIKCFAAVATSYQNLYPESERAKQLENLVIRGMKNVRVADPTPTEDSEGFEVDQVGIIDIVLKDIDGKTRKLSDLKGKVVLVDFAIYAATGSVEHNYELRELYNKYASQGLEIYQVSLDTDEHFWKTTADNLPWVCVRDIQSVQSPLMSSYGIQAIPTLFIVDRDSDLKARSEDMTNVEAEIKKYL